MLVDSSLMQGVSFYIQYGERGWRDVGGSLHEMYQVGWSWLLITRCSFLSHTPLPWLSSSCVHMVIIPMDVTRSVNSSSWEVHSQSSDTKISMISTFQWWGSGRTDFLSKATYNFALYWETDFLHYMGGRCGLRTKISRPPTNVIPFLIWNIDQECLFHISRLVFI